MRSTKHVNLTLANLVLAMACVQYLIVIVGGLVRYCKYKDTGEVSRQINKPRSFKAKTFLQFFMLLLVASILCD